MTSWNPEYLKDIFDRVDENVVMMREAVDSTIPGTPLGATAATDEEAARLFEQKAYENPNWVLALPYVEGGPEELARYERTRGLRKP